MISLSNSEKSFFLTSCGHIYCRDCEENCARGQCKLCGNQCTTIILSSMMKPDVQVYFTDPDELLKKKVKEVQQVSEFQKNHRARLVAHQRKQLKKFKTIREDFRNLIKNLKELDNERKKLLQENDVMKKYISMQRNASSSNPGSAQRSDRGRKSPYEEKSPLSTLNTVFTKFTDKRGENSKTQRITVITPPSNGKIGVIPSTESPSSCLRKLNLSRSTESLLDRNTPQYISPMSTPGSVCDKYGSFATPLSSAGAATTLDAYSSPTDFYLKNPHYKRDIKKLVVIVIESQLSILLLILFLFYICF
ncbi:probable E3 SUMO-protein ligase RNF212 isoform X3 [Parasteatoda tepidariorum]|uniref:probable E3 SUMO-protein ligase RNF212 isoform X3 n=1 Tax=Parasteatoda tepidariorum TaxID=114398 RepID=UPI0039BC3A75